MSINELVKPNKKYDYITYLQKMKFGKDEYKIEPTAYGA